MTSSIRTLRPRNTRHALRGAALLAGLVSGLTLSACGSSSGTTTGKGGAGGGGGGTTGSGGSTGAGGTTGSGGAAGGGGAAGVGGSGAGGAGGAAGTGGGGGAGGAGGTVACPGAGKSLEFDGDNLTKVTADIGADLPIGNASRTVEMWAYFSGSKSWRAEHALTEYGTGMPCHVFGIDVESFSGTVAKLDPYSNGCGGDDTVTLAPEVPQVGWLHLAWVYDGPNHAFLFTVNGIKQPIPSTHTQGNMDLPTTTGPLAIGAANVFGTNGFTGKIDEFRLWNVARTEAQILASMKTILKPNEPGLVAYYHFDEGTGMTAADAAKGHTASFVTDGGRALPKWVDSTGLTLTCSP